jgi:hypothetical protein
VTWMEMMEKEVGKGIDIDNRRRGRNERGDITNPIARTRPATDPSRADTDLNINEEIILMPLYPCKTVLFQTLMVPLRRRQLQTTESNTLNRIAAR